MELKFRDYLLKNNLVDFTINSKEFTGITGNSTDKLLEILFLKNTYQGTILIDNEPLSKEEINIYKKKISIINQVLQVPFYQKTILEIMYDEIRRKDLVIKDPKKKIYDALKIVGLDTNILERYIRDISSSERYLLFLSIGLLSNPNIIILEEPFKQLDKKQEKELWMLLQKLKEQYQKTIILISNDSNILYKYTKHIIITKNNKILTEGNTEEIYQNVTLLKKNEINIPEIVFFTYLARKKKKAKIDFHKDIRDIIKDIYKHV